MLMGLFSHCFVLCAGFIVFFHCFVFVDCVIS